MRVSTIADVLQQEEGETVMAVTGIIDSIFEQNTGTNEHGDWALQNMVIKEGATKIKVKLADQAPIPLNSKGKKIWLCCTHSDKHGWLGLKVKTDTYKGESSKIISATKTADVSFEDPTTGQQPPPAEAPQEAPAKAKAAPTQAKASAKPAQAPAQQPAQQPAQAEQQAPAPTAFIDAKTEACRTAVKEARKFLGTAANGYWLCLLAGEHVFRLYQERNSEPMTEGQFQAMVSTMYISMDKRGLIDGLPVGDITPFLPSKPAQLPAPAPTK